MRDFILNEIKNIAEQNGGIPPGSAAFAAKTGITQGKWRGVLWARWSDALAEAGFSPNKFQSKLDSGMVLAELGKLTHVLGRFPSYADIRLHKRTNVDLPNDKTLTNHFGNVDGLREALRRYAQEQSDAVLLAMIPENRNIEHRPPHASVEGCVYLMKSGAHFKIGRTDTIARRIAEIRTTLPEAVELIHTIRTDDPVGIEAYWHRRFADRRKRGEWFALDRNDVKAFVRRSFQ
jgi:Meiotically up-regulated gene 113